MVAEAVGFEPTRALRLCWFSRPVHSTTLPRLREGAAFWASLRAGAESERRLRPVRTGPLNAGRGASGKSMIMPRLKP